jgi:hypothetical protein
MRSRVAAVLLIVCSVALVSAQKTRFGQGPPKAKAGVDYAIKVHISGIHLLPFCSGTANASCYTAIYVNATVNGQKVELMGSQIWGSGQSIRLVPGDYQARLLKAPRPAGANPIDDKYELVLPDRTVWQCTVTGISE